MTVSVADFGRVAVLYGGVSAEREVSLRSGQAVLTGLLNGGVDAHGVDATDDWMEQLRDGRFDRVFNILHGGIGENGVLQGVLECLGIPYTGSGVAASSIAMDKYRSKCLWRGLDLPIAEFVMIREECDLRDAAALGFPLMVKPSREGSSIGMAKVMDESQLRDAWQRAGGYDSDVMAEVWIPGPEYTAAILDNEVLPLIRIEAQNQFYDYDAKYESESTMYHCPCGLDEQIEVELKRISAAAFTALDGCGWGRVDLMMDSQGKVYLLEVNTAPGMTDHSLVPMAAKAHGLSFDALVWKILETTLVKS